MEISVIIPVYRVEEYLEECVSSILSYEHQGVEVVLVDDGSPDSCPELCDEFAEKNQRVKVVHKENGGLSSARNAGTAVATGKYITFVDSDDIIYTESLPVILEWIKNEDADICFLQSEKIFLDGTRQDLGECIESKPLRGQPYEEALSYLASRPKYPGSAWGKLFRREFLMENDIHFPYDRRYSEDLGYIRDCFMHAKKFDALEIPFYRYRQNRKGSITNKITIQNFNDLFLFIEESVDKFDARKNADSFSKNIMSFVAYEYSVLLYLYFQIPKRDRKAALVKLKKYLWTLKYAKTPKTKMIHFLCRLFGVRFTAFVMEQYKKVVAK